MSFGNIQPFDLFTERIVPSIFVNRHLIHIQSNLDGDLLDLDPQNQHWTRYDANSSLFAEAQVQGWNPAVLSGWYNPYCRIFSQILANCQWTSKFDSAMPFEAFGASEDKSSVMNAWMAPR